jgi:hypothetical protein
MSRPFKADAPNTSRIGRVIKERRTQLKLTQAGLGKLLGYRYGNFIAMIEAGNAPFPLERWEDYASALGLEKGAFLRLVLTTLYPNMSPYLCFVEAPSMDLAPESSPKNPVK